ncbi:MAG TPA: 50S ribosomal protein L11 methyltransferase [Rudaea sp.]|nr:50S ribosomal protein L11 methyltransferase [Rudaea sp.]
MTSAEENNEAEAPSSPTSDARRWLALSLRLHAGEQERIEAALADLGALSVTLGDARADAADEQAIFEPGVGETPLWDEIVLEALFDGTTDRSGLVHALADLVPELAPERVTLNEVAEQDWTRAWMDQFHPMRFGRRLWIYPWNIEPEGLEANAAVVRLDPGLAFGTGTHPTTALCLEWLDAHPLAGACLIDYGCGSGVLAIAALKLGAARVLAIDNDAQAIASSRDNAERNGVGERLELHLAPDLPHAQAEFLVANILAGPLAELAPYFAAHVKGGGKIALSGILAGQHEDLVARYAEWFGEFEIAERDGWLRIAATRTAG